VVQFPALLRVGTTIDFSLSSFSSYPSTLSGPSPCPPPTFNQMSYQTPQRPLGDVHYNQLNASNSGMLFRCSGSLGRPHNISSLLSTANKALLGYYDANPYVPPKKKRSKWLIIGLPLLILVIIGAVVGGVLGSRHNSSSSSSGGGGGGGQGTVDSAHSSLLHQQGRFAVSTDSYFLPVYPSTVSYPDPTAFLLA